MSDINFKRRFVLLDALRVFLALYVFVFHSVDLIQGWEIEDTTQVAYFARFGFLAVDAFFIISGFSIVLSTKRTQGVSGTLLFIRKRLIRLIPGFLFVWLVESYIFVFDVGIHNGSVTNKVMTAFKYMLPLSYKDVELRNFVAWSLAIEITFYAIYAIFLLLKSISFFTRITIGQATLLWAGLHYLALFNLASVPRFVNLGGFSCFFMIGIALAINLEKEKKKQAIKIMILILPILATKIDARILSAPGASTRYSVALLVYAILIGSVIACVYLPYRKRISWIEKIGRSSYVMYLLGGSSGMYVISKFNQNYSFGISLLISLLLIVAISLLFELFLQKKISNLIFGKNTG